MGNPTITLDSLAALSMPAPATDTAADTAADTVAPPAPNIWNSNPTWEDKKSQRRISELLPGGPGKGGLRKDSKGNLMFDAATCRITTEEDILAAVNARRAAQGLPPRDEPPATDTATALATAPATDTEPPAKPAPTHLDKDHGFIITGPEGMETSYQVSVVDRHAGKGPQLFIKDPVTSERFFVIAVFPDRLNRLKLTKSTKYNGDPERPGAVVCYGEKYQEGPELNKFMPTQVMRGMVLVAKRSDQWWQAGPVLAVPPSLNPKKRHARRNNR